MSQLISLISTNYYVILLFYQRENRRIGHHKKFYTEVPHNYESQDYTDFICKVVGILDGAFVHSQNYIGLNKRVTYTKTYQPNS